MNIKKSPSSLYLLSSSSFILKTLSIIFLLIPATTITLQLPQYAIEELELNMRESIDSLKNLYSCNNLGSHHEGLIFSGIKNAFEQIEHRNSKKNILTPEDIGKISTNDIKNAKRKFYQNLEKESQKAAIEQMKQNNFENAQQVFDRHKYLCKNVINAQDCDCINDLQIAAAEFLTNDSEQKQLINEIAIMQAKSDKLQKELNNIQTNQQSLQKKLAENKKSQQNNLDKILKQANT